MSNIFSYRGTDLSAFLVNYHKVIDAVYIAEAKSALLEGSTYNFVGFKEIKIPQVYAQGLANYNVNADKAFPATSGQVKQFTYQLTRDRALSFEIDTIEAQDILGTTFDTVKVLFDTAMKYSVIPEYDADRFATLAQKAGKKIKADLTSLNAFAAFDNAIEYYQEIGLSKSNLWCFITPATFKKIKQDISSVRRTISVASGTAGLKINREIYELDGLSFIIVPSERMWDKITLNPNYRTLTETSIPKPNYEVPADARKINFLLVPRNAGIEAVTRHQTLRVFSPEQNIFKDAHIIQLRSVYDMIVPKNKEAGIYAHIAKTR